MIKAVIFDCYGVLVSQSLQINKELLEYIKRDLKPNYKIGMLSNVGTEHIKRMFKSTELKLFDSITLSSETGIAKPDPRAYQTIAMRLGAEEENSVFIDDQIGHCQAAQTTGMLSINYKSFDQMKRELDTLLYG